MKWQPIETAPRDGTKIILFLPAGDHEVNWKTKRREPHDSRVGEGLWENNDWYWANDSCGCCWSPIGVANPTHWMPLPEPPEGDE